MSTDSRHVFDAANDLRIGSEILESRFGQPVFPLRSTVVTSALSAELYLKCLLYISGKKVPRGRKGHDLSALYQRLETNLQQQIVSNFKSTKHDPQKILDLIDEFKDTFMDWRYIYERQMNNFLLNFKALRAFVQALDKTVREERPQWE